MKKIYIQPITKFRRFDSDTLLISASEQDEWADGKERRGFDDEEEYVNNNQASWGRLW